MAEPSVVVETDGAEATPPWKVNLQQVLDVYKEKVDSYLTLLIRDPEKHRATLSALKPLDPEKKNGLNESGGTIRDSSEGMFMEHQYVDVQGNLQQTLDNLMEPVKELEGIIAEVNDPAWGAPDEKARGNADKKAAAGREKAIDELKTKLKANLGKIEASRAVVAATKLTGDTHFVRYKWTDNTFKEHNWPTIQVGESVVAVNETTRNTLLAPSGGQGKSFLIDRASDPNFSTKKENGRDMNVYSYMSSKLDSIRAGQEVHARY